LKAEIVPTVAGLFDMAGTVLGMNRRNAQRHAGDIIERELQKAKLATSPLALRNRNSVFGSEAL